PRLREHALSYLAQSVFDFVVNHASSPRSLRIDESRAVLNPQSEFRAPQSESAGRRAGVEVGEAFDQHGARDAEEDCAVEPIVADAVAAVDGERDGELVESEPAVEGEADLYNVAATERTEFY